MSKELPIELINKIIMMSRPQYKYIKELKEGIAHVNDWNIWDYKVNFYTHENFTYTEFFKESTKPVKYHTKFIV